MRKSSHFSKGKRLNFVSRPAVSGNFLYTENIFSPVYKFPSAREEIFVPT